MLHCTDCTGPSGWRFCRREEKGVSLISVIDPEVCDITASCCCTLSSSLTDGSRLLKQPLNQYVGLPTCFVSAALKIIVLLSSFSLLMVSYVFTMNNILYGNESKNHLTIRNCGRL